MDGLSVAASVAGVISLGIQVTQTLVDFYEAYKGLQSYIAHTTKRLGRHLNMFKSLEKQLASRNFRLDDQDLLKNIKDSMNNCQEYISELQSETESSKPT